MESIRVESLSKTYRRVASDEKAKFFRRRYVDVPAVNNISFSIDAGEIVGYLGPNGAGKSTTIKMLTGILQPTSGQISVCGIDPTRRRRESAANIAVTFGQRSQLNWDLPVRDSLLLSRYTYHLSSQTYQQNYKLLDRYLEIEEIVDTPVRQLSLGQRMRADFAFSMMHMPKILFLDEPTIGLDVLVKERLCACIMEINRVCGTTVLITTHDVQDIETLCQKVIIIDKGHICFNDSLAALKQKYGASGVVVKFTSAEGMRDFCNCMDKRGILYEKKWEERSITLHEDPLGIADSDFWNKILETNAEIDSVRFRDNDLSGILKGLYTEMQENNYEK